MTRSSPTTDVVAAVRRVMDVMVGSWDHAPYDIVACVLRDRFNHTDEEAHALIFEAVMAGHVVLTYARVEDIDRKDQLCIEMEAK